MLKIRNFEPSWTYFEQCCGDGDGDDDDDDVDVDDKHSKKEKNHHDLWQSSNSAYLEHHPHPATHD